jgi:hypothetical protein
MVVGFYIMAVSLNLFRLMTSSRTFKIISHLSEALILEEEEFTHFDDLYVKEFSSDFHLELEYLKFIKGDKKEENEENIKLEKLKTEKSVIKRIHKKLVMLTHPDIVPDQINEFRKIQMAYEEEDCPSLLIAAIKHNIDIELSSKEIDEMMKDIQSRRKNIENKKVSVRWIWCQSDKSDTIREKIYSYIQINTERFNEWKTCKED